MYYSISWQSHVWHTIPGVSSSISQWRLAWRHWCDNLQVTADCALSNCHTQFCLGLGLLCVFSKAENWGRFYDPPGPGRWKWNVSFSFGSHLVCRAWHILRLPTIVRPTKFVVCRPRHKFNDEVAKNSCSRLHKTCGHNFRFHFYRESQHWYEILI